MQAALPQKTLKDVLQSVAATDEYIELVSRYKVRSENKNLLQLALDKPNEQMGKNAAGLLLQFGGSKLAQAVINGKDTLQQNNLLAALGSVGSNEAVDMLQGIA